MYVSKKQKLISLACYYYFYTVNKKWHFSSGMALPSRPRSAVICCKSLLGSTQEFQILVLITAIQCPRELTPGQTQPRLWCRGCSSFNCWKGLRRSSAQQGAAPAEQDGRAELRNIPAHQLLQLTALTPFWAMLPELIKVSLEPPRTSNRSY